MFGFCDAAGTGQQPGSAPSRPVPSHRGWHPLTCTAPPGHRAQPWPTGHSAAGTTRRSAPGFIAPICKAKPKWERSSQAGEQHLWLPQPCCTLLAGKWPGRGCPCPAPSRQHGASAHALYQPFAVPLQPARFPYHSMRYRGRFPFVAIARAARGWQRDLPRFADCSGFPGTEVFYKYPLLLWCSINNRRGEQWEHATASVIRCQPAEPPWGHGTFPEKQLFGEAQHLCTSTGDVRGLGGCQAVGQP